MTVSWRNCTSFNAIFKMVQLFLLVIAIGIYRAVPFGPPDTQFLVIGAVIGFIILASANLLGYFFGQGASMQEALLNFVGTLVLLLSGGFLIKDAERYYHVDVYDSQNKARACAAFQIMAAGVFLADAIFVTIKIRKMT